MAFYRQIISIFHYEKITYFLWLVPVSIFFTGVYNSLNYWNTRTKHFIRLSISRIINALVANGGQLGAGYGGYASAASLIYANILGQISMTAVLPGQIWRDEKVYFRKFIRWDKMIKGLKRYSNFPLYSTFSSFVNTLSWQLPVLLFGVYFSPAIVGFYALGLRVLQFPMSFIGGSLSQVFFQRAAEAKRRGFLGLLVENIFNILLKVGLVPITVLTLIGGDIFAVIFGEA